MNITDNAWKRLQSLLKQLAEGYWEKADGGDFLDTEQSVWRLIREIEHTNRNPDNENE